MLDTGYSILDLKTKTALVSITISLSSIEHPVSRIVSVKINLSVVNAKGVLE